MHSKTSVCLRRIPAIVAGLLVACCLATLSTAQANPASAPTLKARQVTQFQLFYIHPADSKAVPGRAAAIQHIATQADAWLESQIGGGLSPRFVNGIDGLPSVITLQSILPTAAMTKREDISYDAMPSYVRQGIVKVGVLPIFFIEGEQDYDACAWEWDGRNGPYISFPMDNCDIHPTVKDAFPDYGSYTLAHEIVHALGAVDENAPHEDGTSHVKGDPQDLMTGNDWDEVDWDHLMLDPGRDDYLRTGRGDLVNIENSPLLERASSTRWLL